MILAEALVAEVADSVLALLEMPELDNARAISALAEVSVESKLV